MSDKYTLPKAEKESLRWHKEEDQRRKRRAMAVKALAPVTREEFEALKRRVAFLERVAGYDT